MLEKEMPLLRDLDQRAILGGSMPSTTVPVTNGYCLFNAMSYAFEGTSDYASDYYHSYVSQFGTDSEVYGSTGEVLGFSMSGNQMLDLLNSSSGYYCTSVGSNLSDIYNSLNGGTGNEVMAVIQSQGAQRRRSVP